MFREANIVVGVSKPHDSLTVLIWFLLLLCLVKCIIAFVLLGGFHFERKERNDMKKYLENQKWISCGVNLDEDIHFSTTYLRMSLDKNIGHIFCGYSSFVAIYENFNEEYFLKEDECFQIAERLTRKIITDFPWFEQVLDNIIYKTDMLRKVFDEKKITQQYLSTQSNAVLKSLYKMQLDASLALYEYARIPEVLDRGVNYFTNYLMNYLKQIFDKSDVYEEFFLLTTTTEKSIFQQADDDLQKIVQMIPQKILKNATVRSLRLDLPIKVRNQINAYVDKWRYLEYHGYGMKKLIGFDDVLLKIISYKNCSTLRSIEDNFEKRRAIIEEKGISLSMQKLFEVYPRLATTKLYRKYYQIRNFYFLDMIISEIACRLQETEAFIRCMLPEEIIAYLETGSIKKENIKSRISGCVYAHFENSEFILVENNEIDSIKNLVKRKIQSENLRQLFGYPVSKGFVTGKSIIINRKEDMVKFQDGDIVLSDSADPDIFDLVKRAGAVLTVQGGATSHVALFCREQGIPAIVGIKELMRIQDGTSLEIDAHNGEVRVLCINKNKDLYKIGEKAKNLGILKAKNFNVPDYAVLNYSELKEALEHSDTKKILQRLLTCELELSNDKKYIFRSSAINEDTLEESGVGKFSSIANLNKSELLKGIEMFIAENSVKNYVGSIIFQEMLPFNFCGVAITGDSRLNSRSYVTIELCVGSHNTVTEGVGQLTRIIYDRERGEVKELTNAIGGSLSNLQLSGLVSSFLQIEKIWDRPVDIEWGIYNERLYILQARPIVIRKNKL